MYSTVTDRSPADSGSRGSLASWVKGNAGHAARGLPSDSQIDDEGRESSEEAHLCQNLSHLQLRIEQHDRPIRQSAASDRCPRQRASDAQTRRWSDCDPQTRLDRFQQMRELASLSAKASLLRHEGKQCAKLALDKLLVMIVGALSGLLLLHWSLARENQLAILPAVIAFFVVVVWGAQCTRTLLRLALIRLLLRRVA